MRIDPELKEVLMREYELIQKKESKLSRKKRDELVNLVNTMKWNQQ